MVFKFIKNLFKKEVKEEIVLEETKDNNENTIEYDSRKCIFCEQDIGTERKRWANGKLFHKKCFKKATSDYLNGNLKV